LELVELLLITQPEEIMVLTLFLAQSLLLAAVEVEFMDWDFQLEMVEVVDLVEEVDHLEAVAVKHKLRLLRQMV
jgi:hypothetical protein